MHCKVRTDFLLGILPSIALGQQLQNSKTHDLFNAQTIANGELQLSGPNGKKGETVGRKKPHFLSRGPIINVHN